MTDTNIVLLLGFATAMVGLITPIVKLNSTITKLNVTLDTFQRQTEKNHNNLADRVTAHGEEIDRIGDRLNVLETKVSMYHKGDSK